MRGAFVSMCAVLAASLALCIASMLLHYSALDELEYVCGKALTHVRYEDSESALAYVGEMERSFGRSSRWLELLASHDSLHDIHTSIAEARVALECEDMDDSLQALERLRGSIDHMRQYEGLSLANLY